MRRFLSPQPSSRWVCALSALLTASAAPSFAQPLQKRVVKVEDKTAPTTVQAEQISGRPEREVVLERNVELVQDQTRLTADKACYRQVEDEVEASGNIRMRRFGDQYAGDELKLNLDSGRGYILNPSYKLQLNNAQGKAQRIDFLSQEEAVVLNGTYSTCEGPDPDWYLKASTLDLDAGRDVGVGSKTILYFKDVPILGTPAMSFSLSGARRSGLLPPIPGFSTKGGAELTVPYYFNIAPNRDLTLYPRYIARRGLQVGANGRYIGETRAGSYAGETYAEVLPSDKVTGTDRYFVKSTHSQALARNLSYGWQYQNASDNDYPSDFAKTIASSAERQLLRELRTDYRSEYWSLTARSQNYQVLQDPASVLDPSLLVVRPYDRLPQINFHAARFDVKGLDLAFDSELTRFWHPDLVRGNRAVAVPQISYPLVRPGYFLTPKLILNASTYKLEDNALAPGQSRDLSLTRTVPTFSADSGLVFERQGSLFGQSMTQTLEPRLFYVYTPYRDQGAFPNFDTALATFNFAQLFSENRFVGPDRIGDTNQATAALVSRFLDPDGAERLRLAVGERFYFSDQRVQLDETTAPKNTRSDILLAAAGRIAPTWGFDSALQYNPATSRVISSNYGVQWQPAQKKVLNLGQRYLQDSFKNLDASVQWPLSRRWYGVGRVSYSMRDNRVLESLAGFEYNGDCWVFRMGAQRFVTTANNVVTPIFFQLELTGLSKLGVGNPLDVMTRSVPGYQRLNPGQMR
jgi:LPS-assembly protein